MLDELTKDNWTKRIIAIGIVSVFIILALSALIDIAKSSGC